MLHPIPIESFDFASVTTRQRAEESNSTGYRIEADRAACEQEETALASIDPMTADPVDVADRYAALKRRRHATTVAAIACLQARLPIITALHQDQAAAHQEATEALAQAQTEVVNALRAAGLGAWLDQGDRTEIARLVGFAAGPAAAAARLDNVRDAAMSLTQLRGGCEREIRRLTAELKASLQDVHGKGASLAVV